MRRLFQIGALGTLFATAVGGAYGQRVIPESSPLEELLQARSEIIRTVGAGGFASREQISQAQQESLNAVTQRLQSAAKRMAESRSAPPLTFVLNVDIPLHASAELEEFLVAHAQAHNERVSLERQLRAAPAEMDAQIRLAWEVRNASALAQLQERAQRVAAESAVHRPKLPTAPAIPRNASPALREFLLARHALLREQAAFDEQIRNLRPTAQAEARQAWHESQRTRFDEVVRQAEQLSIQNAASPTPRRP